MVLLGSETGGRQAATMTSDSLWMVLSSGAERGPVSFEKLCAAAAAGKLRPDHQVRLASEPAWRRADSVPGLFAAKSGEPEGIAKRVGGLQNIVGQSLGKAVAASRDALQSATAASAALLDRKPGSGAPPPPPPPAPPQGGGPHAAGSASSSQFDAIVAEVFMEHLAPALREAASVSVHPRHAQRKFDGARSYAPLQPGEILLVICDSTFFGDGTAGSVLTSRGLRWRHGEGTSGRLDYVSIGSPAAITSRSAGSAAVLTIAGQPTLDIPCAGIDGPAVQALARFVARAVAIHQGSDPAAALPRAQACIARGDVAAAVEAWEAAWQANPTASRAILDAARASLAGLADRGPVEKLVERISAFADDRERHWIVAGAGCPPDGWSVEDVVTRYAAGEIMADDRIRHASESVAEPAREFAPLRELPARFFRESSDRVDAGQLAECRAAFLAAVPVEEVRFFGPIGVPADDASAAIVHLGLTADAVFLVAAQPFGDPVVQRTALADLAWECKAVDTGHELSLVTPERSVSLTLPATPASAHLIATADDAFLGVAEALIEEKRRGPAKRLLGQISNPEAGGERLTSCQEKVAAIQEVLAAYEGGHPQHIDRAMGGLRLDQDGLEFSCLEPGESTFIRIPWEQVIDIGSPQRGAAPNDIRQRFFTAGNMLSMGATIAASCIIPGGAIIARSFGQAVGGGADQGPPLNRLTVAAMIDGTSYRMQFDVFGGSVAEMSQKAKAFWSKAMPMKPRFFKAAAGAALPARPVADPETKQLLTDIRNMLVTLTELMQIEMLGDRLVESGRVDEDALRRARDTVRGRIVTRSANLFRAPAPPPAPAGAIVIACPSCGRKIRLPKPGIIACPSCGTKARVSQELFDQSLQKVSSGKASS